MLGTLLVPRDGGQDSGGNQSIKYYLLVRRARKKSSAEEGSKVKGSFRR